MKGNFPSALLMIGGVGLAVHYEQLVNSLDGVPLIVAWGKPVSGKTTAANAAMAITGQRESIGGKNASRIIIILLVSRNNVHIVLVNKCITYRDLLFYGPLLCERGFLKRKKKT